MEKVAIFAKFADRINPVGEISVSSRINNQSVDTTGAVGDALTTSFWGSVLVGLKGRFKSLSL